MNLPNYRTVAHPGLPAVDIYCPFPLQVHHDEWKVEAHVRQWARRFNLVASAAAAARFDEAEFGRMTARIKPYAADPYTIGEWISWIFLVDDQFDDAGDPVAQAEAVDRFVQELRTLLPVDLGPTPVPTGPAGAAAADMWPRTAPSMSRYWRRRFVDQMCGWIELYKQEIAVRRYVNPPSLSKYIPYRRVIGGADTGFDLIEFAAEFSLSPEVFESDIYQAMRLAANDVACWVNDIVSLAKENARGDFNNLVAVLQHEGNITLEQALAKTSAMIEERTRTCHTLRDEFTAAGDQFGLGPLDWHKTVRVVDGLGIWLAGSLDWHLQSGRFLHVEHTEPGQHPSYFEPIT